MLAFRSSYRSFVCASPSAYVARNLTGRHACPARSSSLRTLRTLGQQPSHKAYMSSQTRSNKIIAAAAAADPLYEIYVKGAPEEGLVSDRGELGDCPFSQRSMMHLEEKAIPYKRFYVDEMNMKDIPWLSDVTEGACQIPFMKETKTGKWYHDSDFIVSYLEDEFPQKKIGKPDTDPQVGKELFPTAFIEYLTTDGDGQRAKEERLLAEFQKLEDYLAESTSDYFGGSDICSTDLALSPRVKHILIGGKAVKGFELPSSFKEVHAWLKRIEARDSWQKCVPDEKWMVDGWKVKREMEMKS